MPVKLKNILQELSMRYKRIRTGVAIGFDDATVVAELKNIRGGVWMSCKSAPELPYDDAQFEVAVVSSNAISREMAREVNRILLPDGCMFFSVNEKSGSQDGLSAPEVYKIVREGFDILAVHGPKWWMFGLAGRTLTVCAKKKAWREHRGLRRDGVYIFNPFEKLQR